MDEFGVKFENYFGNGRMRKIPFFVLIIILLGGCNSQSVSFRNYEITQLVPPSTPEPNNSKFILEPIFTPTVASNPIGITDPTAHPKILPQKATSTPSDKILTDAAYVGIGQQARGQFTLQNVPMVSQENFTSRGEAVFAMAWNYKHPGNTFGYWNGRESRVNARGVFSSSFCKAYRIFGNLSFGDESDRE